MSDLKSAKLLAVKGSWAEQKARLKEKLLLLNATDLNYDNEKRRELLRILQLKLGKTKEEIAVIIASL